MPGLRYYVIALVLAFALPSGTRAESALSLPADRQVKMSTRLVPFSDAAFAKSQSNGQTVVVETYAPWCLPCRLQSPILERLLMQELFKDIVILRIDEKTPGAAWKRFKLRGYASLVVLRGTNEVARGTPTTEAAVIALLRRAN